MSMEVVASQNPFITGDGTKIPAHQVVYDQIRAMILYGDLAPGQPVTIQGLVGSLQAGMTPVREALRRLIAEGALIHQGNRRVSVPRLTIQCLQELDFMRRTLEPELARRAAMNTSKSFLVAVEGVDNELNRAISQGDIGGYLTLNHRFHALIYDAAQAPIMAATVDRLWLRFGPSLRVVCGRFGTSNLPDMHQDIIKALKENDPEAAAAAMAGDVDQGMRQIEAALQEPEHHI